MNRLATSSSIARMTIASVSCSLVTAFVGVATEPDVPLIHGTYVTGLDIEYGCKQVIQIQADGTHEVIHDECAEYRRREVDWKSARPLSVFDVLDTTGLEGCWAQSRKGAEDIVLSDVTSVTFGMHVALDGRVTHVGARKLPPGTKFERCADKAITAWHLGLPPGVYTFEWQPPEPT